MLSEPMLDAAPVGDIAVPEEPELVPELLLEPLPEGMLEPAGGVDGIVDGLVDGGLIGAGLDVSSTFFPQAPRANNAESATTATAGLKCGEFMGVPFKDGWKKTSTFQQSTEIDDVFR